MIIELLSRIINHERFIEINSDPYIKIRGLGSKITQNSDKLMK